MLRKVIPNFYILLKSIFGNLLVVGVALGHWRGQLDLRLPLTASPTHTCNRLIRAFNSHKYSSFRVPDMVWYPIHLS